MTCEYAVRTRNPSFSGPRQDFCRRVEDKPGKSQPQFGLWVALVGEPIFAPYFEEFSMNGVAFVNHLRLGSASSFRQAGLAKYLDLLGVKGEFLGLRGRATGRAAGTSDEWRCFERISYWNEPLVTKFRENLRLFGKVAQENPVLHVNRANPYTATIATIGKSGRNKLVVDMEDWDGYGGYSSYASLYGARGALLTLYENTFPRIGDLVVTVSHLLTSRMVQLGVPIEKTLLIPNGYDEELFSPSMSGDKVREQYGLKDLPRNDRWLMRLVN